MLKNNELLMNKIDEMNYKIELYETEQEGKPGKKTYTGYLRTLPVLEALETFAYDNEVEFFAKENDNLGVIVEAMLTSFLKKKPQGLAPSNQTDLVTGGRRFDIKFINRGSSSLPSVIDENTKDDILLVGNMGVHILRNENIKKAISENFFKKERTGYKVKTTIFKSDYLVQTEFTKRIEQELGVKLYDGRK